MAAAALSRSRGEAGVKTTKGLFFIFTLLSLVCVASSWIDKNQLEKHKEDFQKAQQRLDSWKAEMVTTSELMSEFMSHMDPMMVLVKEISEASPGFLPVKGYLENIKSFMEKAMIYADVYNEELDAEIDNTEEKLVEINKFIKFMEEYEAEL